MEHEALDRPLWLIVVGALLIALSVAGYLAN
jgi:hypothetical protein